MPTSLLWSLSHLLVVILVGTSFCYFLGGISSSRVFSHTYTTMTTPPQFKKMVSFKCFVGSFNKLLLARRKMLIFSSDAFHEKVYKMFYFCLILCLGTSQIWLEYSPESWVEGSSKDFWYPYPPEWNSNESYSYISYFFHFTDIFFLKVMMPNLIYAHFVDTNGA